MRDSECPGDRPSQTGLVQAEPVGLQREALRRRARWYMRNSKEPKPSGDRGNYTDSIGVQGDQLLCFSKGMEKGGRRVSGRSSVTFGYLFHCSQL